MPSSVSTYDVLGVGAAVVDICIRGEKTLLAEFGFEEGDSALIGQEKADFLYRKMYEKKQCSNVYEIEEMAGGAAANVVAAITAFGGKAAFIGKVAEDSFGEQFNSSLRKQGVMFETPPDVYGGGTARSFIIVTKGGERSMNTYLGVAEEIREEDINPRLIDAAKIVFIEGFLWDYEMGRQAAWKAIKLAKEKGKKVAFSLSDWRCVKRHREDLLALLKSQVDILFANEQEIKILCGADSHEKAVIYMENFCREYHMTIALTKGSKGAVVISPEMTFVSPAVQVESVIDTTGVGALFVAGFLYAHLRDFALPQCARLANLAAAEGLGHLGARPAHDLSGLLVAVA